MKWLIVLLLTVTITELKCLPSNTSEASFLFPQIIKIDVLQKWEDWGLIRIKLYGNTIGKGWIRVPEVES